MEKTCSRYEKFDSQALTLRDELAIDRTLLANERTLLAYLRSGVALVIAGITILHFPRTGRFWAVGLASLPVGVAAGVIGLVRYRRMVRAVSTALRKNDGMKTS
jgi:putative membrane protein